MDRRGYGIANMRARIDHREQRHTRRDQVRRRLPAAVATGQHDRTPARRDAEPVAIRRNRARQHHAGPVIAVEHDRPLGRARRQDRARGNDFPHPLARLACCRDRDMIRNPFDRAVFAIVKTAKHRGPHQHAHIRHGSQFGQHARRPCRAALPAALAAPLSADADPFGQQLPARHRVFIGDHDAQACIRRVTRRDQPGGTCTNHQQIAERVIVLIGIGVFRARYRAQPGRAADQRLVQFFPCFGGPHERLVVEPCNKQRRGQLVHRHHVERQAGPAVLAGRDQPLIQFYHRRGRVRLGARASAQGHQRVGFRTARGQNPARAMVFETAPEQPHAMRQQRRSERIAGVPGVRLAVEGKRQGLRAVDQTAAGEAKRRPAHTVCSGCANRAAPTACVRVSRSTRSHLRHPCV